MISRAVILAAMFCACASDAPGDTTTSTYLGDSGRTGFVDAKLPEMPVLQWVYHEKHPPRHAWPEPNREVQYIDFDYATQVAISEDQVFFGSSADHKVYAVDLASGDESWSFYTEGPVRFAPVVDGGRVFAASDDGYLYCLDSATGQLLWKFRGGPRDEKLIGNEQMISHWPARSGVLVDGDRLYFTAGMWSRDGVFLYCLDLRDGSVIWKNDTSGYHFTTLPHSTGFGGVAPQGYLALHRGRLYVPTGRGAPAAFDAATGEFKFYENGLGYKPHQPGGSAVMAWRDWVIFKRRSQHQEESVRYEPRDPARGAASGLFAVHFDTGKVAWSLTDRNIVAARGKELILAGQGPVIKTGIDELMAGYAKYWKDGENLGHDENIEPSGVDYTRSSAGRLIPNPAWMSPLPYSHWQADVGRVFVLLCVRDTILAGGRGSVSAIDLPTGKVLWQKPIDGEARGICAVDGRFVVSSTAGKLYCFGAGQSDSEREVTHQVVKPRPAEDAERLAAEILQTANIHAGYALMLGVGDGRLLTALIENSDLTIYCLEPDAEKIKAVRETLDAAGWLGVRAAVHRGAFETLPYNHYFANLIVWGEPLGSGAATLQTAELYRVLRPYGGVACQIAGGDSAAETRSLLADGGVPGAEVTESPLGIVVRRGRLPGAGQWTHPHGNIGRTGCSEDELVRLPLGMLWWGGPGPSRIVSRHWRAPSPLFANGVLYVQGEHDVFAVDAYNGREMWNRHLEGVGRFPPTHRGGNIVADDDGVYCIQGLTCLKLNAATGETIQEFTFPLTDIHRTAMAEVMVKNTSPASHPRIVWEFLGLAGNYLLGTLGYEYFDDARAPISYTKDIQQSKFIFAFDAPTGKLLWEQRLERSVSPTAIVADQQAIYLLDRAGGSQYEQARRRGAGDVPDSKLKALDLATGEVLWTQASIPSAWKALMMSDAAIVAYPNPAENDASDGDKGVGVFAARDGEMLWSTESLPGVSETGRGGTMRHTFIVGDTLFLPWAYDLHSGAERLLETNPLTGQPERFSVPGKNFCGTFSAACDLLIYRSASVGFAEISRDSGSYWLPESRPSCWISAIPAGGMVLAPEGYSTCICPYNYKTSLALVPVERNEDWSVYLAGGRREKMAAKGNNNKGRKQPAKPVEPVETVRSLRLNLNAPGDQMDSERRLWLAWPRPVDPKNVYIIQQTPVQQEGETSGFRLNSDYHPIAGTQTPWLYTSGLTGPVKLTLRVNDGESANYTVVLHFAETEAQAHGQRVFDVRLQGKNAITGLDVAAAASGADRACSREFQDIAAEGTLTIELIPVRGRPPVICAVEVLRQP
jgi:outer membrane protein assembly factor BamB